MGCGLVAATAPRGLETDEPILNNIQSVIQETDVDIGGSRFWSKQEGGSKMRKDSSTIEAKRTHSDSMADNNSKLNSGRDTELTK